MDIQNLQKVFNGRNRIDRLKHDLSDFPVSFFTKDQNIYLDWNKHFNPIKIFQENNILNLEFEKSRNKHTKYCFYAYIQALEFIIHLIKNPNKYLDIIW